MTVSQLRGTIGTYTGCQHILICIGIVHASHVGSQLGLCQTGGILQWLAQRAGVPPQLLGTSHVRLDVAVLIVILGSTLQEGYTDTMVLGNGLVVVNQVIECPGYLVGWVVLSHVVAVAVDTVSSIGDAQTIVLQFRTKLDAVLQALQWLPYLTEIYLSVGAAVDAEVGTLVGIVFQLIDWVDDVHVVSPWVADIIALRIVRHGPWNHGIQGIVVIARTGYRLAVVVTVVLGSV